MTQITGMTNSTRISMEENVTSDVSRHFSFEVYVHFTILEIIICHLSKGNVIVSDTETTFIIN